MVPKARMEAPAPPKAKAKALKTNKGIHRNTKKDPHITHLPTAKNTEALKAA